MYFLIGFIVYSELRGYCENTWISYLSLALRLKIWNEKVFISNWSCGFHSRSLVKGTVELWAWQMLEKKKRCLWCLAPQFLIPLLYRNAILNCWTAVVRCVPFNNVLEDGRKPFVVHRTPLFLRNHFPVCISVITHEVQNAKNRKHKSV